MFSVTFQRCLAAFAELPTVAETAEQFSPDSSGLASVPLKMMPFQHRRVNYNDAALATHERYNNVSNRFNLLR